LHALSLLTFAAPNTLPHGSPLQRVCRRVVTVPPPKRSPWNRLIGLISGAPDLAGRLRSPHFERALIEVLHDDRPDVVQIEGLELAGCLAAIRTAAPSARIVFDAHNAEHVLQQRALETDLRRASRWPAAAYSALQVPRLARLEASIARAADAVVCVSDEDATALRRLDARLAPVVVPNGIDVSDFANVKPPAVAPEAEVLVFTGKMDYRPNVDAALWFADEILPGVRLTRPKAEFHVVGQQPVPALLRLNGRNGVVVTGRVPDTRPHIAGAAVYVAPLRMGGGTRFKLLEAFALGSPCVSTRVGAEGFDVESGRELLLADTPRDFVAAVLQLLSDRGRASRLARAAQLFVRAHYDWSAILPRLAEVYAALQAGNSAACLGKH
jgi:glycosyltransferase involved in cell wall biosynthesis